MTDPANTTEALHAEADDLQRHRGMVSGHWVAARLRFIAEHGRRWPQTGEGVHISRDAAASTHDWTRYERTCAPDRQIDGLGDLALFLGGSETSFTGRLLDLIAKAQATPANMAALERGFPREVHAWRVWAPMSPSPTAAELCAALTLHDNIARATKQANDDYAAYLGTRNGGTR